MQKPLTICLVTAALAAGALSLVKVDGGGRAPAALTEATGVAEAAAAEEARLPTVIRMAQLAVGQPYMFDYERGPRIIQVPQRGDGGQERSQRRGPESGVVRPVSRPAARASVERRPEPAVIEEDDDDEVFVAPAPTPRPRAVTPKPRAAAAPAAPLPPQPPAAITPRWKLRSETPPPPPPSGPRRAVLSAPPPSSVGPTPLRPTPNFDNKAADRGEKFVAPREPAPSPALVTESQPPLGYSPPATPATPAIQAIPAAPEPAAADVTSSDVTSAAPPAEPAEN